MGFRHLRERKQLSQEKLAEASGLSLRTVQRAEAGHRVSYASLRALAATFAMDVDQLERELYAMQPSTDEFVEIPRWVRLWTNAHWYNAPPANRRRTLIAEAFCIALGVVLLGLSFVVTADFMVTFLRVGAAFQFVAGYLVSVTVRIMDTYRLWPTTEVSPWQWRPVRTLRGTLFDYGFVLLALALFWGLVFWLAA
jgi:transcriptional regulator with XRE-family HTH domain